MQHFDQFKRIAALNDHYGSQDNLKFLYDDLLPKKPPSSSENPTVIDR